VSTAAAADRPLHAVKSPTQAAMAETLARRQNAAARAAKAVRETLSWPVTKALKWLADAARFLHLDQAYTWLMAKGSAVVEVAGTKTSATYAVTSKTGQRIMGWTVRTAFRSLGWTLKTTYRILTWPLNQLPPTRRLVSWMEIGALKVATSTPVVTITNLAVVAGSFIGAMLSADRPWIQAVNAFAFVVASVRLTRRFAPSGIVRLLTYVVEIPVLLSKLDQVAAAIKFPKNIGGKFAQRFTRAVDQAAADELAAEADEADAALIMLETELLDLEREGKEVPDSLRHEIDEAREISTAKRERAEEMQAEVDAQMTTDLIEDLPPVEGADVITVDTEVTKPDPSNGSGPAVPPMSRPQQHGPQSRKKDKGKNRPPQGQQGAQQKRA